MRRAQARAVRELAAIGQQACLRIGKGEERMIGRVEEQSDRRQAEVVTQGQRAGSEKFAQS